MRRRRGSAAAGDAAVIESSWREPERFAVLFDRHVPHIHRYLARRADRQVADDLVAETFLAAFAKRDRYDLGHADARPWLYGIAANLIGQHHRDEARQYRIRQAAAAQPEVPGHADRVAADVTAQAVRAVLEGALAALSDGDRDVLLLIAWEQLTYQEVSRALDIPVGTVQSRLHRARKKTRQVLAGTDAAATYEELMANE
ncbi:MAG: RNA polymerase sigma factor [Actinomycetota bacterium]|nr:RNA polymerase sigma factor [Actinomycetota bacterium]